MRTVALEEVEAGTDLVTLVMKTVTPEEVEAGIQDLLTLVRKRATLEAA